MKKNISILTALLFVIIFVACSSGGEDELSKLDNLNDTLSVAKIETLGHTEEIKYPNSNIEEQENSKEMNTFISEASWAFDVSSTDLILEDSNYVIKVRVKTKEKAKFESKNAPIPKVRYNVEVLETLYGSDDLPKNIKVIFEGGVVTAQDIYNHVDEISAKKMGLNKLKGTEEFLLTNDAYYQMELGEVYYLTIRNTDEKNNVYALPSAGYNIFYESEGKLFNVLSNNELVLD